jgi:hypothetical protein
MAHFPPQLQVRIHLRLRGQFMLLERVGAGVPQNIFLGVISPGAREALFVFIGVGAQIESKQAVI